MTIIGYAQDMARVREIARERVVMMFDSNDGSYGSLRSKALFFEYRAIREHYGNNTPVSLALKAEHDRIWEEGWR